MFRHIVLLTLDPDAGADAAASICESLRALPGKIPEIRSYVIGLDAGLDPTKATLAVLAGFDDLDGYLVYRDHPEHRKVIDEEITPVLAARSAIQFEE